jgi:hypothetical protein
MTVSFDWHIITLERYVDTGAVYKVYWCLDGTLEDNGVKYWARESGNTGLQVDNISAFIPYSDLTEADVVAWLESLVDSQGLKEALTANLENQRSPKTAEGVPWIPEKPTDGFEYVLDPTFNIWVKVEPAPEPDPNQEDPNPFELRT